MKSGALNFIGRVDTYAVFVTRGEFQTINY
jgi:hypothetical protein